MNYYFPYTNIPAPSSNVGLLSRIFKNGINWNSILSNTQKTLNIINQTIPLVKQVGPVMNNAKTMFKLMNEFKKVDTPEIKNNEKNDIKQNTIIEKQQINNTNNPTFFQ